MTDRRIPSKGLKDDTGAYVLTSKPISKEPSVDGLLRDGLAACQAIMDTILLDVKHGTPERETVQNLKDLMAILQEMKKRQLEATKDASTEDLEAELEFRTSKNVKS